MTPENMLETIRQYRKLIKKGPFNKVRQPPNMPVRSEVYVVEHCFSMLDEIELNVRTRHFVRARQQLRFVQGAFFAIGLFTLEEIHEHNNESADDAPPG